MVVYGWEGKERTTGRKNEMEGNFTGGDSRRGDNGAAA